MKRKSLFLDVKKFNLMLERMEHKVNYDESVVLKKKLLIESPIGKAMKELMSNPSVYNKASKEL